MTCLLGRALFRKPRLFPETGEIGTFGSLGKSIPNVANAADEVDKRARFFVWIRAEKSEHLDSLSIL
jgi:hypothetical protein